MLAKFIELVPSSVCLLPNDDLPQTQSHVNVQHAIQQQTAQSLSSNVPFYRKSRTLECCQTLGEPSQLATLDLHVCGETEGDGEGGRWKGREMETEGDGKGGRWKGREIEREGDREGER